jgi:hypothetical protein
MNSSSNPITTQPVISYLDKSSKKKTEFDPNHHKNSCEKCITCNSTRERCPINCYKFGRTFVMDQDRPSGGSYATFGFYSFCCLPFTLIINSLFCGSCTIYNVLRNKCDHNKDDKNYLC